MAGTFSDDKFTFDTIEIEENFLSLLKVNLISNEDASNELSAIFFNDNNNTTKVISEKILTEFTKIVKRKYVNKNKDKKQAFSYEALSANMAKVSSKSYAYEYVPNYYDFLLENKCSKITPQVLNPWTGYHFGEQISNAQIELDLQIEKMSRKYMESFGIQEFQRFKSISEETLTVVGRIIIDEKDEHSDTYLENISDSVALNLSMLREYNLFSGQVVIAKGSSDSFTFFAKEIATEINLDYEDRDERL